MAFAGHASVGELRSSPLCTAYYVDIADVVVGCRMLTSLAGTAKNFHAQCNLTVLCSGSLVFPKSRSGQLFAVAPGCFCHRFLQYFCNRMERVSLRQGMQSSKLILILSSIHNKFSVIYKTIETYLNLMVSLPQLIFNPWSFAKNARVPGIDCPDPQSCK